MHESEGCCSQAGLGHTTLTASVGSQWLRTPESSRWQQHLTDSSHSSRHRPQSSPPGPRSHWSRAAGSRWACAGRGHRQQGLPGLGPAMMRNILASGRRGPSGDRGAFPAIRTSADAGDLQVLWPSNTTHASIKGSQSCTRHEPWASSGPPGWQRQRGWGFAQCHVPWCEHQGRWFVLTRCRRQTC